MDRRRSLFLAAVLIGLAVCVVSVQAACEKGCECLTKAEAEKLHYVLCGEKPQVCGDYLSNTEKYCFRKQVTPAPVPVKCDEGCSCMEPAKATAAGYLYCDTPHAVCGYDDNNNPLYCFRKPEPVTVPSASCDDGCSCISPEKASAAGYTFCNGEKVVCNKDTAGNLRYCYGKPVTEEKTTAVPVATVKPVACPKGCSCLNPATVDMTAYRYCGGKPVLCGYDAKQPLYCFEKVGTKAPVQVSPTAPGKGPTAIPTTVVAEMGEVIPGGKVPAGVPARGNSFIAPVWSFFASLSGAREAAGGASPSARVCAEGLVACGDRCVDLRFSEEYCGWCGTACYADEICCGGTCISRMDGANCGQCGHVCPDGSPCMNGVCNAAGCFYGRAQCGNTCVNLRTDRSNCGACGNTCDDVCFNGVCTKCLFGTEVCGGSCVDPSSDRENCSACRNACAEDAVCEEGTCVTCGAKLRELGGSPIIFTRCGNSCVDLQSDRFFCGDCDTPCPAGKSCCGGSCLDLSVNKNNCGECGHVCTDGEKCIDGACRELASDPLYCGQSAMACPVSWRCCDGLCTNIELNDENCGGCGTRCGTYETCCDGTCVDTRTDAAHCGDCTHSCSEAAGEICRNGECIQRLCGATGRECTPPEVCCNGQCLGLQEDEDNCGVCGNTCQGDEECCLGACVDVRFWNEDERNCGRCGNACRAGQDCCNGECVNRYSDERNCARCGNACGYGEKCCDGRCIDVLFDDDNCWSCGRACEVECVNGKCCGLFRIFCV